MREAYTRAGDKCLATRRKETVGRDTIVATINEQFLKMAGYSDEEVSALGDLSKLSSQEVQEIVRKKSMEALGLNGNSKRRVVPLREVKNWIVEGWEFVTALPTEEAVMRLPKV
jgi:hypothetical protein